MPRPNTVLQSKGIPTMDTNTIIRADVAFNTPTLAFGSGISGSPALAFGTYNYKIGRLPIGAEILFAKCRAVTAFAGPTAAGASVGCTATAYTDILPATSVLTTAAFNTVGAAGLILVTTAELDLYLQIITTVAVATAGLLRAVIGVSAPLQ